MSWMRREQLNVLSSLYIDTHRQTHIVYVHVYIFHVAYDYILCFMHKTCVIMHHIHIHCNYDPMHHIQTWDEVQHVWKPISFFITLTEYFLTFQIKKYISTHTLFLSKC